MLPSSLRTSPPSRWLMVAVALAALAGAGCSNPPAATGSAPGGAAGNAAADGGGGTPPTPAEMTAIQAELPEFSRCMRAHGVPDFPDPGPEGGVVYYGSPDPAVWAAADDTCKLVLPEAGRRS